MIIDHPTFRFDLASALILRSSLLAWSSICASSKLSLSSLVARAKPEPWLSRRVGWRAERAREGRVLEPSSEVSVRYDTEDLETDDREEIETAEFGGECKD